RPSAALQALRCGAVRGAARQRAQQWVVARLCPLAAGTLAAGPLPLGGARSLWALGPLWALGAWREAIPRTPPHRRATAPRLALSMHVGTLAHWRKRRQLVSCCHGQVHDCDFAPRAQGSH